MNNPSISKSPLLKTPVLFLVFNRLDTTKEVMKAIREARPDRLYIAADGPRTDRAGEAEKVSKVRAYVLAQIDWDCDVRTNFREENLGCKYAVSTAISWFFENEEQGIILEDDCLPCQSFFRFCEDLLEKYKDDHRVWHIGGTNPIDSTTASSISNEYYFSAYNRIWGWATWKRAWDHYDVAIKDWPALKKDGVLERYLGRRQAKVFSVLFDKVHAGKIDTWDYQWFLIRLVNGLAIIPKVNLISNLGFGSDATHTFTVDDALSKLQRGRMEFPLCHPKCLVIDFKRDDAWATFCRNNLPLVTRFKMFLRSLMPH